MTTEATSAEQPPGGPGAWAQLAMTAISLIVLGGFVLWQVRPVGHQAKTSVIGSAMQNTLTEGARPMDGLAEQYQERQQPYSEQAAWARAVVPTIYIVESQERAETLRAGISQMNAIWAAQGEPPLNQQVVWFAGPEAEAEFLQGLTWALGVPDLSSLSVIDLRR